MKPAPSAALLLLIAAGACNQGSPSYSLSNGEVGVFASRNAGSPISLDRIKSMSEQQVIATFGTPALDRKDGPTVRALRYDSDGCSLFVYLSGSPWKVQFADAYDTHLRPLASVDQCAGSVAAQKGRVA
jgi:hypothetical protein